MQVIRHPMHCPERLQQAVVALGSFDGLHTGHQAIIAETVKRAKAANIPAGLLSFEPHPREVLTPDAPPFRLTSLHQKLHLLKDAGLDALYIQRFSRAFAALSPHNFIQQLLVDGIKVKEVLVGKDFIFGHRRQGDVALLAEAGKAHGFTVNVMEDVGTENGHRRISSTAIREHIKAGEMADAAALLGRPYAIMGRVIAGDRKGRELGFPTANLRMNAMLRPRYGVYAALATLPDGTQHKAAVNIGIRPTVSGTRELLEAHLLNYTGDLYGQPITIVLQRFLRPEQKFDSLQSLKAQIAQDVAAVASFIE